MSTAEGIDQATLTELLAQQVDPALRCTRVSRAAVGNGQETWLVDAADAEGTQRAFVLRRSAPAGVLDDTDREHEFATLATVAAAGLPTPRVHWLETEPSRLVRPYFVMDRLPGRPPAPRSAADAAAIARDLGRRLAQLHAADLPVPAGADVRATTADEVARWRDRYHARRVAPVPLIGALLAWLEAQLPDADVPPRLLWGDAGPHNVLVEGTDISALLDWELSHVGHPLEDLGAAVWACLGRYPQDEVVAGYEEAGGTPVDRGLLAYFSVLGCVSRSIMQLAGVDSFVRGETNALNLAGLGLALPIANLHRAAAYAGWQAPHQVAGTPAEAGDGDGDGGDSFRLRPDVAETLEGIARFLQAEALPATADAAHLQRGLKTAVGLLRASAARTGDGGRRQARLAARLDGLFDRLAAAGVATGARDAAALEAAAVHVETDPSLAAHRDAVRRTLLTDLVERAEPLEPLVRMYGRDVTPGPGFGA